MFYLSYRNYYFQFSFNVEVILSDQKNEWKYRDIAPLTNSTLILNPFLNKLHFIYQLLLYLNKSADCIKKGHKQDSFWHGHTKKRLGVEQHT